MFDPRFVIATALAALVIAPATVAQDAKPEPARPADAAPLYETAAADLCRLFAIEGNAFGIEGNGALDLPELEGNDPCAWRFAAADWQEIVAKAAPALTVFAQAARMPECRFGAAKDPMFTAYDERSVLLYQAALLTAAHGHARVAGANAEAAQDAFTLLRHARQAIAQPTSRGVLFGAPVELLGLALLREVLGQTGDSAPAAPVLAQCATELELHARASPGRKGIATAVQAEVRRWVAVALARTDGKGDGGDAEARLMRERPARLKERIDELVTQCVAPLQAGDERPLDAVLADIKEASQMLRDAKPREIRQQLPTMTPEAAIEALARMMTATMVPDLGDVATKEQRCRQLLAECRDQLRKAKGG